MDNLQSVTYQTFEQDPVKYAQYEEVSYARSKMNTPIMNESGCLYSSHGVAAD